MRQIAFRSGFFKSKQDEFSWEIFCCNATKFLLKNEHMRIWQGFFSMLPAANQIKRRNYYYARFFYDPLSHVRNSLEALKIPFKPPQILLRPPTDLQSLDWIVERK